MARILDCPVPAGSLRVRVADSFVSRALGLLVGAPLAPEEALLIAPCSSIHTFGMRYPIDVAFIDADARIVRVCPRVPASRVRFAFGAHAVLEMHAGAAARLGLDAGVRLEALAATQ
jgi:uncharacterized membrane protein (UPF0127 family)